VIFMGRVRRKVVSARKLSVRKRSLKVVAREEALSGFVDLKIESDLCPFDGLPCEHPDCCDDALGVAVEYSCSRAVVKVRKK
jgi:hypothetical protein